MSRRDFVRGAAGMAAAAWPQGALSMPSEQDSKAGTPRDASAKPQSAYPPAGPGPRVISSANGLKAIERAIELLRSGGDPVDAAVAAVNVVEDDPNDHSVGLGGLPNEEGVVELDSCVMHGPTAKGGAVAAIRNIRNPSRVATLVMRRTDHVLLVGEGALRFARAHGFKEEELLTEDARKIWLEWKETHSDRDDWLHPEADVEARRALGSQKPPPDDTLTPNPTPASAPSARPKGGAGGGAPPGSARHPYDGPLFTWGTISCMALTAGGDLGGCTSTSGLSYKLPGRVGDSPILGAGLYVDNAVGAAGSTGRGEANLLNCSSFLVVQKMADGLSPQDACFAALQRVADKCEPRLRNARGEPDFQLTFYAIRKDGQIGGAAMRGGGNIACHDGSQARLIPTPALFAEK